jgi:histone H3/H4
MAVKGVYHPLDMDRLIRNQGAERVGEDASRKLNESLADSAREVLFQARILATHAGRKHLTREDVLLAARHLQG